MKHPFRESLDNAIGITQHVIAIILDIRGFTPFCQDKESLDVATYIRRVYAKIIDDYFPSASFYKPTGDGLLIVIPVARESLQDTVRDVIATCLRLVENFKELCKDDPMINFETPEQIGIGVARGNACCITSNGVILDYSGRVINLASRLMDAARPSGVVADSSLGLRLLPPEMQKSFLSDEIYVRGISEDKPMTVHYTKDHTVISLSYKDPIKEPHWVTTQTTKVFKDLKSNQTYKVVHLILALPDKPLDEKQMLIEISFMADNQQLRNFSLTTKSKGVYYESKANKHYVKIDCTKLIDELEKAGATDDTAIILEATYATRATKKR
jgi:class 3 adenylate cyclase